MNNFNFDQDILSLVEDSENEITNKFQSLEKLAEENQFRVIKAMQECGLSERHFLPATGYGYGDQGREIIEQIFSKIFKTEKSLVRPHISSGTHAIACALYGNLLPGDEIVSISGSPYETVKTFINDKELAGYGTLQDLNVTYQEIPLKDNLIDVNRALDIISSKTKIVYIQRSTGYSWRKAFSLDYLKEVIEQIKEKFPNVIIFMDNCYGEFLDYKEPAEIGVDLIAGSLIKNPGGGLAPTGGYVSGRKDLVDKSASRLSAPGIAGETGATMTWAKTVLQGLFQAPVVTVNALKSAILTSKTFEKLSYEVCPEPNDLRSDIIQSIKLEDENKVKVFCRAIQEAAPVDSFVTPEPWEMPGYKDQVIMAAGAFIAGSSIELSADAPIREPYIVYYQGGITYPHGKLGLLLALQRLKENDLLYKE